MLRGGVRGTRRRRERDDDEENFRMVIGLEERSKPKGTRVTNAESHSLISAIRLLADSACWRCLEPQPETELELALLEARRVRKLIGVVGIGADRIARRVDRRRWS